MYSKYIVHMYIPSLSLSPISASRTSALCLCPVPWYTSPMPRTAATWRTHPGYTQHNTKHTTHKAQHTLAQCQGQLLPWEHTLVTHNTTHTTQPNTHQPNAKDSCYLENTPWLHTTQHTLYVSHYRAVVILYDSSSENVCWQYSACMLAEKHSS